jgi:hypothetical protein
MSVLPTAAEASRATRLGFAVVTDAGEWRDDPDVVGRKRAWRDGQWSDWVHTAGGEPSTEPYLGGAPRWQYGIVALGSFGTFERMSGALGELGQHGWELVTVYDKASNWMASLEKGFMLLKRPVPPGQRLGDDKWCIAVNLAG